ncbi:MAG: DMT family transporter [Dehalococcoidales bacterium]|nr:MAG: DMT family transporter [Dehalococcoidales bacterium]
MTRQYSVLALGVISVSFAAIFIRLADVDAGTPSLVIAAYRLCIASLILAPAALMRSRQELRRLARKDILLAVASGAFLALHFALWIASLSYTSVATSVVLVTITPIFVAVASYLLFRERLTWQVIAGIVVCLTGAVLIGYGNWQLGSEQLLGGVLALLGALAVAGYLLIGRRLRQEVSLLSYSFVVYSSAAVILLVAALVRGYPLFDYSGETYLWMVMLALVPQLLGHMSLVWALRFVSATLVTIAVLGEPVGATALAFVILDEAPTWSEIVGGVLILAGIFLAFRRGGAEAVGR